MNRQIQKTNGQTVVVTDTLIAIKDLLNGVDQFIYVNEWQGAGIETISYLLNSQTVDTVIEVDA